jgi:UPF0755 protein
MSQFGLIPDRDQAAEGLDASGRPVRRRRSIGGLLAVVVSLGVLGAVLYGVYTVVRWGADQVASVDIGGAEDFTGPGSGSVEVVVQPGQTSADIGRTLKDAGVVASVDAFFAEAAKNPEATGIQPGTYALPQGIPAAQALELLILGDTRVVDVVTIREGLRVEQTIGLLAEATGIPARRLTDAAQSAEAGLPPAANGNPEGFLFPATYEFPPDRTPRSVIRAMTTRFDQASRELNLEERAAQAGLSLRDVVIVASLIQAEARLPEDFGKVSRVIYNRLDDGDALFLDSTVLFAAGEYGVYTSDEQRALDNPYNTYRYPGLPPGPINSPGEDAFEAALNPTPGPWRYFVTVNLDTGETKYAETLAEHERNVAELRAWEAAN